MSTRWSDPPIILMGITASVPALIGGTWMLAKKFGYGYAAAVPAIIYTGYHYIYCNTPKADTTKYLEFKDAALQKRWGKNKIPASALYEAFVEGKVSFKGDTLDLLRERAAFICYRPTFSVFKFLWSQFVPFLSSSFHDKRTTKREIADHYDRGNDFFAGFLGKAMVYTSAVFYDLSQSLETAQDNKMSLICDKLQLRAGQTILDIGCGWGTLVRHAAKKYGAKATGVTLSVEGAKWCREKNSEEGIEANTEILCMDYRDIPKQNRYDRISSIEMAEHVGLRNFQLYLKNIKNMLKDDGLFMLQVAGLRQGSTWEDVAWGLFMSKYIFPGADASTPLNWYIRQLELAGFEVHSVETIGRQYSHTLHRWYNNFMTNRASLSATYPEKLLLLWEFFLAWSVVAAGQGTATCYQILVHKNTSAFERDIFVGRAVALGGK